MTKVYNCTRGLSRRIGVKLGSEIPIGRSTGCLPGSSAHVVIIFVQFLS
jgi:hypothetical protein